MPLRSAKRWSTREKSELKINIEIHLAEKVSDHKIK